MGYNTRYELSAVDGRPLPDSIVNHWFLDRIGPGKIGGRMTWYGHEDDVRALSKAHPDRIFILDGVSEERPSIWRKFFRNGEMREWHLEPKPPANLFNPIEKLAIGIAGLKQEREDAKEMRSRLEAGASGTEKEASDRLADVNALAARHAAKLVVRIERLNKRLRSLRESFELCVGPQSPFNEVAKGVIRGFFTGCSFDE